MKRKTPNRKQRRHLRKSSPRLSEEDKKIIAKLESFGVTLKAHTLLCEQGRLWCNKFNKLLEQKAKAAGSRRLVWKVARSLCANPEKVVFPLDPDEEDREETYQMLDELYPGFAKGGIGYGTVIKEFAKKSEAKGYPPAKPRNWDVPDADELRPVPELDSLLEQFTDSGRAKRAHAERLEAPTTIIRAWS